MAGDKTSTLISEKPEDLRALLKEDRGEDCLSCRLVGSGSLIGLAAYSFISGHGQLKEQKAKILASKSMLGFRSRQAGITGISIGLFWLGVYRFAK